MDQIFWDVMLFHWLSDSQLFETAWWSHNISNKIPRTDTSFLKVVKTLLKNEV
jgi:hypothetical protein